MKNRQRLSIISSIIALMFIMSLFSGTVAAQSPDERIDEASEQYRLHKEKYENTKKKFEEAKDSFEKARQRLRGLDGNEEINLRAKEYLIRLIDHMIEHLNLLKYRMAEFEETDIIPFSASANIDAHLRQLDQLRARVDAATSYKDYVAINRELKELWVRIRLETRYYLGIVMNHRIDAFIAKTNNIDIRMDTAMQKLKDKGIDTSRLQDDIDLYRDLVRQANASHQKTVELFETHNGFADEGIVIDAGLAGDFLQEADKSQRLTIKNLKDISKAVLKFVRDFREISRGEVTIEGSATETLSGNQGD
jgi:hypothetical protein